jgi:hypothetical protein
MARKNFKHKETKVFISGSISLKILDIQATAYLDLLIANQYTVLIGDAFGIDKAVQKYLFRHAYKSVIVYYSGDIIRNNIGNWRTKHIKNKNLRTGKEMYQLKDEAMARDADCGLMIWDNKSPGTKYNMENMIKLDKPVIVLKTMNIHPDIFSQYVETGKRMDKRG